VDLFIYGFTDLGIDLFVHCYFTNTLYAVEAPVLFVGCGMPFFRTVVFLGDCPPACWGTSPQKLAYRP
jgi:hypothetical protein